MVFDVQRKDWCSVEVVYRHIKETLDLRCVQVHGQNAVNARFGDEVRNQFRADRRASLCAAVLTSVTEVGDHCGDTTSRRTLQRVGDDQQFHQVVVGRVRRRLNDEHIFATDVFENFDKDFAVVETLYTSINKVNIHATVHRHATGNGLSERFVGVPRNQFRFSDRRHVAESQAVVRV